jgi:integrase
MNFLAILDYYSRNGLYQSNHDYLDKFNHLMFFAGKDSIKIDDIHDYCSLRTLSGVKNATVNRELNIARSAINYYNKHNDINIKNPFNGFNLFESDFIPKYLNAGECSLLLETCKQYSNPLFRSYISLLLNTGSRSGELLTLQWDNVFLDDRYLIVRNSLSKNKKTVYKPLNNQAIIAFSELSPLDTGFVFLNTRTNDRYKSFRKAWLWAKERSGIDCRIHDLRHTFASLLVSSGVPLYHVSQLLGHSDTRITQRYAHLSPDNLLDVVQQLPKFE